MHSTEETLKFHPGLVSSAPFHPFLRTKSKSVRLGALEEQMFLLHKKQHSLLPLKQGLETSCPQREQGAAVLLREPQGLSATEMWASGARQRCHPQKQEGAKAFCRTENVRHLPQSQVRLAGQCSRQCR